MRPGGVTMNDIPPRLVAGLSPAAREAACAWWSRLAEDDRTEVVALCSAEGRPPGAPKVIGGCFLPDDEADGWSEWLAAYFEHLIAQPDPAVYEPPFIRSFRIG